MPYSDTTSKPVDVNDLEVGLYRPISNSKSKIPGTPLVRPSGSDTSGPPKSGYNSVGRLPETKDDYYIPGTNK